MDATADPPRRSFAFGLERAGLAGLARPRLAIILLLLISVLAALGLEDVDRQALFVSPRDQEEYVLRPQAGRGGIPPPGQKPPVILYERTGQGGRRYAAYPTAQAEEVDDQTFRHLVPEAP